MNGIQDFIGKYVQVYPHDTLAKFGTVVDVNENGVIFKVDGKRSHERAWVNNDGSLFFISFSANLSFVEVKK